MHNIGSLTPGWVARGLGLSTSNPEMTLHVRIYQYIDAPSLPPGHHAALHSVYMHDTDFISQTEVLQKAMTQLHPQIILQLTFMLYEVNPYTRTFQSP